MLLPCPKCKCLLPGRFDTQSYCPYCSYKYGKYAKLCLDCDRAWFPIVTYCPECGKKTGVVKVDELTSLKLGWFHKRDSKEYEADFSFGAPLSEVSFENEYDLKSRIQYG